MKEIILPKGYKTQVDDENYEYLSQFKWLISRTKKTIYAYRYIKINGKNINISMHRIIMNTPEGMEVDHIDHNGLNNQKSNLRNCTHQENLRNKVASGTSNYIGVSRIRNHTKYEGKFRATISNGNRNINLGIFDDEIEAAKIRDIYAKKYHGTFANLNFKN